MGPGNAHLCRDCGILILLASGGRPQADRAEVRTRLPHGCFPEGAPVFPLLRPSCASMGAVLSVSTALCAASLEGVLFVLVVVVTETRGSRTVRR